MHLSQIKLPNVQYQYDSFNHLKIVQSVKDITKCKELQNYEKRYFDQILQANIQQAFFMFVCLQYGLKVYNQNDLFLTPQGNIVFLSFAQATHQKLGKVMTEVNTQNIVQMLLKLKKKMGKKLQYMQSKQFSLLNQWQIPIFIKNQYLPIGQIQKSQIYQSLLQFRIFQKHSLKARVYGSILIRKLDQLPIQDLFYIKTHLFQFSQIIQGFYLQFSQKQKQKSAKLNQIFIDLTKCGIFQNFSVFEDAKQNFHQKNQNSQIAYLNQSFIISIKICNCHLEQFKSSYKISKYQNQEYIQNDFKLPEFPSKQSKTFNICFISSNTLQIKLETSWKISEALFITQFKKKIKGIVQKVNRLFITNSKTEPFELIQFDIEMDKVTCKISLVQKIIVQKKQLGLFTILKGVDQLVILYLALVKVSLYYQILSFDFIQRYCFCEPTQGEQSNIVKNIYAYWGILSQKYEKLKRSSVQQRVTDK